MSKASKLSRMRNTVLESTGLRYNTSGQTVELNFFPDSTKQGVSVPLVLKGNTGPSTAPNTPPLLGYPFAHIVDSKPYNQGGGDFFKTNPSNPQNFPGFQLEGGNGTTEYYRSRTFQTRIVDEIGVSMVEVASTSNDGGGPGTFLNFPVGTYYLSGSAPAYHVRENIIYWCNYTKAKTESSLPGRKKYIESPLGITGIQTYSHHTHPTQTNSVISGRFTVTDSNDSYLLLHGSADSRENGQGFGKDGQDSELGYQIPTGVIYSQLKIWKIG